MLKKLIFEIVMEEKEWEWGPEDDEIVTALYRCCLDEVKVVAAYAEIDGRRFTSEDFKKMKRLIERERSVPAAA